MWALAGELCVYLYTRSLWETVNTTYIVCSPFFKIKFYTLLYETEIMRFRKKKQKKSGNFSKWQVNNIKGIGRSDRNEVVDTVVFETNKHQNWTLRVLLLFSLYE